MQRKKKKIKVTENNYLQPDVREPVLAAPLEPFELVTPAAPLLLPPALLALVRPPLRLKEKDRDYTRQQNRGKIF